VKAFKTLEDEEREEKRKEEEEKKKDDNRYDEAGRGSWYSNPAPAPMKSTKTGIGKYLPGNLVVEAPVATAPPKRKAPDSSLAKAPVVKRKL